MLHLYVHVLSPQVHLDDMIYVRIISCIIIAGKNTHYYDI